VSGETALIERRNADPERRSYGDGRMNGVDGERRVRIPRLRAFGPALGMTGAGVIPSERSESRNPHPPLQVELFAPEHRTSPSTT